MRRHHPTPASDALAPYTRECERPPVTTVGDLWRCGRCGRLWAVRIGLTAEGRSVKGWAPPRLRDRVRHEWLGGPRPRVRMLALVAVWAASMVALAGEAFGWWNLP